MTAFLLNSLYTNGDKLESDYNESLSKQKDSEGMGKVYKSAEVEEKRLSRKKDKVKSLEWKLKNKEHRYAFKKRQSKGLNSSFELQIHRKSNSKRQNETRQLNSLRLQVKRKDLKPRKRKMAFRSSTFVTNVRLKEADENYTLSYDVKIVKRKRGGNDVEQYQDSLTNVKLVTSGWLPVFNGNKTKTTAFKNYNKVLSKYDNVLEVGEAKLQAEKEKRDSIGKVVAKLNDTIASAEFVRKVERFTGFANHNALAFGGESKWVKDYDANNGVMNPNVDSVLMTNQYANCSFRNQAFMKEQVRQNKLKRALGAGLGVNLTSMGTYNADAIKQLKRPALIVADYKDEKGKKLDITVIYVFDKTLNGVMRFDGYMDRSPYKFEVSRENAKSLIAFDDEMNAYMIPNDVFKKKIQKSNVEFTLKPFKKAESKEDIKNQLATI